MKKKTEYQLLRDDFFHATKQLGIANRMVRELRELRESDLHEYNILQKENKRLREENEMLKDELRIYKEEE
ncbi:hypothetical protein [Bacillus cereus]|uniref:Uncharacterized protein n=1 Tax=Bacillus cereus TaxID=1396 RepID=A0A9X6VS77_BACCE|nr:hypothetical protein [Bacillus cereus]PFF41886.1 hypothetical protein CN357_31000 [Bacillus cereus]PFS27794.1 hypothetical protein COK47_25810 [Bacillus cereus]PFT69145.1 hypothetical protein COK67_02385 [Bacillus cereus]PGT26256.1 hypothetical protein COC99_16725 [Bacillus cereus]